MESAYHPSSAAAVATAALATVRPPTPALSIRPPRTTPPDPEAVENNASISATGDDANNDGPRVEKRWRERQTTERAKAEATEVAPTPAMNSQPASPSVDDDLSSAFRAAPPAAAAAAATPNGSVGKDTVSGTVGEGADGGDVAAAAATVVVAANAEGKKRKSNANADDHHAKKEFSRRNAATEGETNASSPAPPPSPQLHTNPPSVTTAIHGTAVDQGCAPPPQEERSGLELQLRSMIDSGGSGGGGRLPLLPLNRRRPRLSLHKWGPRSPANNRPLPLSLSTPRADGVEGGSGAGMRMSTATAMAAVAAAAAAAAPASYPASGATSTHPLTVTPSSASLSVDAASLKSTGTAVPETALTPAAAEDGEGGGSFSGGNSCVCATLTRTPTANPGGVGVGDDHEADWSPSFPRRSPMSSSPRGNTRGLAATGAGSGNALGSSSSSGSALAKGVDAPRGDHLQDCGVSPLFEGQENEGQQQVWRRQRMLFTSVSSTEKTRKQNSRWVFFNACLA